MCRDCSGPWTERSAGTIVRAADRGDEEWVREEAKVDCGDSSVECRGDRRAN